MTASAHIDFPADPKPVVNNVWASAKPAGTEEPITLPSGQVVIAKRPDTVDLARSGLLAERDKLSKLATDQVNGKGIDDDAGMRVFAENPELLGDLDHAMCRLARLVVVDPPVRLHWREVAGDTEMIPAREREPGAVYTDQISLTDKSFLSEWAVGDLAAGFRGASGPGVASVAHGQGVPSKGKRSSRNGRKRK